MKILATLVFCLPSWQAPSCHAMELALLPEVGKVVSQAGRKAPLHERVFFMADMNLSIVFLIVLILALWRWA